MKKKGSAIFVTLEEFKNLDNDKKVELLNQYIGKTKEFKADHEFSWGTATSYTEYIKDGGQFVSKKIEKQKEERMDLSMNEVCVTAMKYKKEKKVQKSMRIPETLIERMKTCEGTSVLNETDIVVCALDYFLNMMEQER